ncbi:MAG: DMT family transporter [Saccharospirillaceae bacterium]|nr:DMT family transporter [Pseudomonadales bacterium]NRB77797.1 DMT family transporter [Saccharospirillaceae bacterium]
MNTLPILALLAGSAIAIQAGMNAHLGDLLKNTMFSALVAFVFSALFILGVMFVSNNHFPSGATLKSIPIYLWFSGVLSAFGVALFYYLIPKMGLSPMMSFALTAQIIVALIVSHFGWFDLPVKQVDFQKLVGVIFLISGIVLVNWSTK